MASHSQSVTFRKVPKKASFFKQSMQSLSASSVGVKAVASLVCGIALIMIMAFVSVVFVNTVLANTSSATGTSFVTPEKIHVVEVAGADRMTSDFAAEVVVS